MPIDMNEARSLVEAAKKRGLIHSPGDALPDPELNVAETNPGPLPDWLQEAIVTSPTLPG